MTLESAVLAGRTAAERLMSDTFEAFAPGGRTVVDGREVLGFTSHGKTSGKVQGGSSATADPATDYVEVGDTRKPVFLGGLHIPISAPVPTAGDAGVGWEYVCTAVGDLSDLSLLGRRYRVVNVPAKSYATARRLDVVEV